MPKFQNNIIPFSEQEYIIYVNQILPMIKKLGLEGEKLIRLLFDKNSDIILNCIIKRSRTIKEISEISNINMRTCYRKVNMLVELGWLEAESNKLLNNKYCLSKNDNFYIFHKNEYKLPFIILKNYSCINSKKNNIIKILSYLYDNIEHFSKIYKACKINKRTCYRLLNDLIESGLVECITSINENGNKKKYFRSKLEAFYYVKNDFKLIPIVDIIIEDQKLLDKINS